MGIGNKSSARPIGSRDSGRLTLRLGGEFRIRPPQVVVLPCRPIHSNLAPEFENKASNWPCSQNLRNLFWKLARRHRTLAHVRCPIVPLKLGTQNSPKLTRKPGIRRGEHPLTRSLGSRTLPNSGGRGTVSPPARTPIPTYHHRRCSG